jgi:SAM-dependent methyltransferase
LKKKGQRALTLLDHNRKKEYLLAEGQPIPFLVELGVMTAEGKVVAKRYHKFKQINRFLELIEDLLPALSKERPLTIIDFGCGKSYLTFALYHFLTASGYQLNIVGLDLKKEVIENCNALAKKLGYQGLSFQVGEISGYSTDQPVDMVVVLHACDTATDEALAQAVQWKSRVILAVPCCQHQLYSQIKSEELAPLLKHGIMKERFAALATDALRAMKLEIEGYKTQILEFIDMEHTPKNLLIRAIRQEKKGNTDKLEQDYRQFKKLLNIEKNLHP